MDIVTRACLQGIVRIKSNQIKSNQIKSNQIKSNQIKYQIKSNQIKSNQIKSIFKIKELHPTPSPDFILAADRSQLQVNPTAERVLRWLLILHSKWSNVDWKLWIPCSNHESFIQNADCLTRRGGTDPQGLTVPTRSHGAYSNQHGNATIKDDHGNVTIKGDHIQTLTLDLIIHVTIDVYVGIDGWVCWSLWGGFIPVRGLPVTTV